MELIRKFERTVHGWSKGTPDLPAGGRRWLGENVWWIVLIGAIGSAIAFFIGLSSFFQQLSVFNSPTSDLYASSDFLAIALLNTIVSTFIIGVTALLLFLAVKPLQVKRKKGWALLFFTLLIDAFFVLVTAVLTFSVVGFIISILFGIIKLLIAAYFIFEMHGEFDHDAAHTTHHVK